MAISIVSLLLMPLSLQIDSDGFRRGLSSLLASRGEDALAKLLHHAPRRHMRLLNFRREGGKQSIKEEPNSTCLHYLTLPISVKKA